MYEVIETRVMLGGPICWKCNGTKFITYLGEETPSMPFGKLGVCAGCGRLYKLNQPKLALIKESGDPEVKKFFDMQPIAAAFYVD